MKRLFLIFCFVGCFALCAQTKNAFAKNPVVVLFEVDSSQGDSSFDGISFRATIDRFHTAHPVLLDFQISYRRPRGSDHSSFAPIVGTGRNLPVLGFSYALVPYWGDRNLVRNGAPSPAIVITLDRETGYPPANISLDESTDHIKNDVVERIVIYPKHSMVTLMKTKEEGIEGRGPYLRRLTVQPLKGKSDLMSPIAASPLDKDDPLFDACDSDLVSESFLDEGKRAELCRRIAKSLRPTQK